MIFMCFFLVVPGFVNSSREVAGIHELCDALLGHGPCTPEGAGPYRPRIGLEGHLQRRGKLSKLGGFKIF